MLNARISPYHTPHIRHWLVSPGGSVPYSHHQPSKVTTWWRALLFPPMLSNLGGSNRASRGQKATTQRHPPAFPPTCLVIVSPSPANHRHSTLLHSALATLYSSRRPCPRCPFHANRLKWKRSSAPHHSGS